MKTHLDSETFDKYLQSAVSKMSADKLLSIGDVYTILAEALNNEVIEAWERDNPLPSLDSQLDQCLADWRKLVSSLITDIDDDCRATDDPDDNEPGMCLTVGFTPETREKDFSWSYQTGDNSFTGGAYGHPHWAVVYLSRESDPAEVADDIASQIGELVNS